MLIRQKRRLLNDSEGKNTSFVIFHSFFILLSFINCVISKKLLGSSDSTAPQGRWWEQHTYSIDLHWQTNSMYLLLLSFSKVIGLVSDIKVPRDDHTFLISLPHTSPHQTHWVYVPEGEISGLSSVPASSANRLFLALLSCSHSLESKCFWRAIWYHLSRWKIGTHCEPIHF